MIDQFISDIQFQDSQYAVIIRSPVQAGILSGFQVPDLPEGYVLYAAADIPHSKTISVFDNEVPIFAESEIAYEGQALAILMGPDLSILHELQKKIDIACEPLPAAPTALCSDTAFQYPVIAEERHNAGNVDHIFETTQSIVYSSLTIQPQAIFRTEPLSVVAVVESDILQVYVPTQWPFHVRSVVASAIGIDEHAVIVHPTQTGEVFNELLWYPSLIACQCAIVAWQSGKTVRLTLSLQETMLCLPKTPEITISYKSAFSELDTITALTVSIIVKAGAFSPLLNSMLQQMAGAALGIYTVKNYHIEAVGLKTPHGLTSVAEDWGSGFISNALEHHINTIVQEKNLSPLQWRLDNCRKNYLPFFSLPFQKIVTESDFHRKYAAYRVLNMLRTDVHDGRWRGIGLSAGFKYNGYPADFTYSFDMCLETDNKLYIKAEPAGQHLKKSIAKLITEALELPSENIVFAGTTTLDMNFCGPAVSENTESILTGLALQCIADLQEQRFRNPLPLHIHRSYRTGEPLYSSQTDMHIKPFISKIPAACVVELELNPFCYEVSILGIWFVCVSGLSYTKKHAINVLHKSLLAALSRTITLICPKNQNSDTAILPTKYRENIILSNKIAKTSIHIIEKDLLMTNSPDTGYANIFSAAYLAALNQILLMMSKKVEALPIHTEDIFQVITGNKKDENSFSAE